MILSETFTLFPFIHVFYNHIGVYVSVYIYSHGPNIETEPSVQLVSCPSTAMYFSQCTPRFIGSSRCGASTTLAGAMCQSSASEYV